VHRLLAEWRSLLQGAGAEDPVAVSSQSPS